MSPQAQVPLAARLFDHSLVVLGCAVVVAVVVAHDSLRGLEWPLLAVIPVVALLAHYPLVLLRRGGGLQIGLDSAVLVFLAMSASQADALFVWVVSTVVVQMVVPHRKPLVTRLFNTGLCTVSGSAAIATMWAITPMGSTGPMEIVAFLAGCAIYFTVDFVLTGVSIALTSREPLWTILLTSSVPLTLVGFLAVNTLGWLAGITLRYAWYGLPLIGVPLIAVVTAMRAFARSHRERDRLRLLFATSLASQAAVTTEDVQEVLLGHAAALLRCERVTLRPTGPLWEAGQIGAWVRCSDTQIAEQWLVAHPRISGEKYDDADLDSLNTLATLGAESLRRARLTAAMTSMARSDPLTGLDNRSVLRDRLEVAIRRDDPQVTIGVVYVDLDRFKSVNDSLGHDAGDELLMQISARLRECVRVSDTVARMGGDEFAILVESVRGAEEVRSTAHRLLAAIAEPVVVCGQQVTVGASVGYALREGAEDVTGMLQRADIAMYSAKETGRSSVAAFTPGLLTRRTARTVLQQELGEALVNGELRVHYQPVIELASGRLDGLEALVRWQHPSRGLLSPADFVDVAEESGLIEDLGLWVLQRSWLDASRFGASIGRPVTLAVNVASRQLRGGSLLAAVAGLATGGMHPTLVLEVTERDLVADVDSTETLLALRALGVKIAVDDFGTGYSSFAYLRTLPVDVVKLDRQFVVDAAHDPRAVSVIGAVTAMTRALGLISIAEGVETQEQADAVAASGCVLAQGHLYARPMPVDELIERFTAAVV